MNKVAGGTYRNSGDFYFSANSATFLSSTNKGGTVGGPLGSTPQSNIAYIGEVDIPMKISTLLKILFPSVYIDKLYTVCIRI